MLIQTPESLTLIPDCLCLSMVDKFAIPIPIDAFKSWVTNMYSNFDLNNGITCFKLNEKLHKIIYSHSFYFQSQSNKSFTGLW